MTIDLRLIQFDCDLWCICIKSDFTANDLWNLNISFWGHTKKVAKRNRWQTISRFAPSHVNIEDLKFASQLTIYNFNLQTSHEKSNFSCHSSLWFVVSAISSGITLFARWWIQRFTYQIIIFFAEIEYQPVQNRLIQIKIFNDFNNNKR